MDMGYDVMLLHARFPFGKRDALEKRALSKFDKRSKGKDRDGILISTQIIEQSLDLDFDAMFTKLAPVDLMLQRAGRLHRHIREGRPSDLALPTLSIFSPDMTDDLPDFGRDVFVYDEYILLRSWLFLKDRASIRMPSDLRTCVESVYGETGPQILDKRITDRLAKAKSEMERWKGAVREKAAHRLVLPPDVELPWTRHNDLLCEEVNDSEDEVQGLTRLGKPSIDAVLLFDLDGKIYLDQNGGRPLSSLSHSSADPLRVLLDSSLRLSDHDVVNGLKGMLREERPWGTIPLLRSHVPLVLRMENGRWSCRLGGTLVVYDEEIGIRYEKVI